MSRRRFFAPPEAFRQKTVVLTADEAKHLREVLRLKPGDQVYVFDGAGNEFRCTIVQAKRDEATLEISEIVAATAPESPLNLTLGVALLKGEKFDLVVQKATELGVTRILPVMTRHADIQLRDASDAEKRLNRWRRIAMEAAKQSGRATVPEIPLPVSFESVVKSESAELRLLFSERSGKPLTDAISGAPVTVITLVGSEGGWADEEINLATDNGWRVVTFGGRILRAETAAITVSVLMQNVLGDLKITGCPICFSLSCRSDLSRRFTQMNVEQTMTLFS